MTDRWMQEALELARQGLGRTSPNPAVGAVLVRDGEVVGRGFHTWAGVKHAEQLAIEEAGDRARGATLYVTLEPCSHVGRTPPCADAVVAAGIAKVVCAMEDPNPAVRGSGFAKLREAGIEVELAADFSEAAEEINQPFFHFMRTGRPLVMLKAALTLDGKIAAPEDNRGWITSEKARAHVQTLRHQSDAIMTGIGTVLADDPRLDVRGITTQRQPLRVVLDSSLHIPMSARILNGFSTGKSSEVQGKLLIYTAMPDAEKMKALENMGVPVCVLPDGSGKVDLSAMLGDLAQRGCNEILVEAGSTLNGALLRAGLVDELLLYLAPQLLGDFARGMAQLGELNALDQRINLKWQDVRQIGNDMRITV
ncbi:MAG: bifunctional diaminohydroxyphosphoribosylaminopyrimidine deaminase/5-amino-6-(5-phosphoribosylamino)uracil reductase RibD, partial [Bryobacteraceae bacterium]